MTEPTQKVTFQGNPLTLCGAAVKIGQTAPDFTAVANDLSPFKLSSLKGKIVIISAVPSLDTPVCSTQTKRFNQEAGQLSRDLAIVTISMDLPFAQSRWCGAEGVKSLQTVSDHKDAAFGQNYGLLIKELRLLTRAVLVIDKNGKVVYQQIVAEITQEPDYNAAIKAVRQLATS